VVRPLPEGRAGGAFARLHVLRDWVGYHGDATPAYGRAPAYPVGHARDFDLSGDGTLGTSVSSDAARTFLTTAAGAPTSYTELSADKLVAPVRIADLDHPVHVELPGIVHRFAAGHKLRLVVYGGDLSYRGNVVPGPVSVLSSATRPSVLHVPVATASDYGPVVLASAAPRACTSRRAIVVHLRKRYRGRVRSAVVEVAGKLAARLRPGRSAVRVSLRGRAKGRYTVRIVMRLKSGRRVVDTRHYRTCTARR
jgi:hypothetical protein